MTAKKKNQKWDFTELRALFINCTLKSSPKTSHTERLMNISRSIMKKNKVKTSLVRLVDFDIAPGNSPDMTAEGFEIDDWPQLHKKVMAADILVVGTPIWLGDKSSVCTRLIERLDSNSEELNKKCQIAYYGRVAGCIITGNEDGIKHCSMNILYSLQHLGFLIPPQVDAGWIGEAGPGASYGDEGEDGPVGFDNDFTQRNTTFLTWNLMHVAHMVKTAGGIPAYGNQPSKWEEGARFDHPQPENMKGNGK